MWTRCDNLGRCQKMELSSFSVEAMVRGYRVYRAIWEAAVGETLNCAREVGNRSDTFAVAVIKGGDTVGHVPRRISSICSIFLRNGGAISCEIIDSRHFSQDLPQGGLHVFHHFCPAPHILCIQFSFEFIRHSLDSSDIACMTGCFHTTVYWIMWLHSLLYFV